MYRRPKIAVTALAFLLVGSGLGAQQPKDGIRNFTDSAGRTVRLPARLERIAPSGTLAQIVLYSLVPDRLIGWSSTPAEQVKKYLPKRFWSLPTFGQFYGKNVSLNLEALIAARPDIIIDIGEAKKTIRKDMDGIQDQTGIPVVFIEATLETFPKAYSMLGELTGETDAAGRLSRYCAAALEEARTNVATIPEKEWVRVYYGEGVTGLQTNPAGSIHADVLEWAGAENVARIPIASGSGGAQITMEQLLVWNPDLIILGPAGAYGAVRTDPLWKDLAAVKAGRVYEIPEGPYNWMGRPPATNRLIGIFWLGQLLYPQRFKGDLIARAKEYYDLFYHYDLGTAEAAALLARSGPYTGRSPAE